jgi:hypothetical protein
MGPIGQTEDDGSDGESQDDGVTADDSGGGGQEFPSVLGPGGSNTPVGPYGYQGNAPSGSPEADAIDASWSALMGVVPQCTGLSSATLAQIQNDYASWQGVYSQIQSSSLPSFLIPTAYTLAAWQAIADSDGDAVQTACPGLSNVPNFPTTGIQQLGNAANSVAQAVGQAVQAVTGSLPNTGTVLGVLGAVAVVGVAGALFFYWEELSAIKGLARR